MACSPIITHCWRGNFGQRLAEQTHDFFVCGCSCCWSSCHWCMVVAASPLILALCQIHFPHSHLRAHPHTSHANVRARALEALPLCLPPPFSLSFAVCVSFFLLDVLFGNRSCATCPSSLLTTSLPSWSSPSLRAPQPSRYADGFSTFLTLAQARPYLLSSSSLL